MDKKTILSISMLVSNRIDTVEKTMKSLKRIMDRVPSELIVVDTVGEEKSDGSLAIAKQYATKLVHFDWINDFAAARNAGLKEATGEWFMFLDDDEEFIEIDDLVEFFNSGEYKNYFCATYKIHDHTDDKGNFVVTNMNRMVKLLPETRFRGRVHEYISPLRLPVKELESFINHHGYVFLTPEDRLKKFNRNWPLLMEEYNDDPWNVRTRMHLVQACMDVEGQEEKAEKICIETFDADSKDIPDDLRRDGCYQWICMAYVKLAAKKDMFQETVARVDRVRKEPYLFELVKLAVAVMDTKAAKELELPERALSDLTEIKKDYDILRSDRNKLFWQEKLDLGNFMDKETLIYAFRNGIAAIREAGFHERPDTKELFSEMLTFYNGIYFEYTENTAHDNPDNFEVNAKFADMAARRDEKKGMAEVRNVLARFKDQKKDLHYGLLVSVLFRLHESVGSPLREAAGEYETLKADGVISGYAACAAASVMTRICLIQGHPESGASYVGDYLDAYNGIKSGTYKETNDIPGDLASFAGDDIYNEMLVFGANVLIASGDISDAWGLMSAYPWNSDEVKNACDALNMAFFVNSIDERPVELYRIIKEVMANEAIKPVFSAMLKSKPGIKQAVDRCLLLIKNA